MTSHRLTVDYKAVVLVLLYTLRLPWPGVGGGKYDITIFRYFKSVWFGGKEIYIDRWNIGQQKI